MQLKFQTNAVIKCDSCTGNGWGEKKRHSPGNVGLTPTYLDRKASIRLWRENKIKSIAIRRFMFGFCWRHSATGHCLQKRTTQLITSFRYIQSIVLFHRLGGFCRILPHADIFWLVIPGTYWTTWEFLLPKKRFWHFVRGGAGPSGSQHFNVILKTKTSLFHL